MNTTGDHKHTARQRLAAAGLLAILAALTAVAVQPAVGDTPDACAHAVTLGDQLPEHHGRELAAQAAYSIARHQGAANADDVLANLRETQAAYTEALAAYQSASADCHQQTGE